ncbi:hypothetical protein L6452_18255 [Arctium lappa]|uniref:Uncharacterized protein n=1 Tax=Arctium lappa TaxID=4217 RepID=A0ACB9C5U9_ARCLA|nr:hypothetical protein L6452_18255 [Arctium lappa]
MPITDERGNTVLSSRDVAFMYMPEIPAIEDERDKPKDQNSALLKQIQEFRNKLLKSDKTSDFAKCANNSKSDFASILGTKEKEIKLREIEIHLFQTKLKTTEKNSSEIKVESVSLLNKMKEFEEKISALEAKNADLMKHLQADKDKSNLEKASSQKISDHSKKISTLQDLLEKERKSFQEKKKSYDVEKKNAEKRNVGIFKEISEKTKNLEKDFELERQNFENEISKLTSKITVLSSYVLKEHIVRTDLKKKFDTISEERNIISKNIKDLEAANVELSDKVSADVINQSTLDNST